jgi:hypothetical protein
MKHGVPHVTILGPILFLLYTHELPIQEQKIILFADDRNILLKAENEKILQHRTNRVINELQLWFYMKTLMTNKYRENNCNAFPYHVKKNSKRTR